MGSPKKEDDQVPKVFDTTDEEDNHGGPPAPKKKMPRRFRLARKRQKVKFRHPENVNPPKSDLADPASLSFARIAPSPVPRMSLLTIAISQESQIQHDEDGPVLKSDM